MCPGKGFFCAGFTYFVGGIPVAWPQLGACQKVTLPRATVLQPAAACRSAQFFFCLCVLLNPELLQLFWVAVCCELFYSTSSRFLLPLFVGMRRTEGKPVKRNKEITCSRSDCSQGRLLKASTSMP